MKNTFKILSLSALTLLCGAQIASANTATVVHCVAGDTPDLAVQNLNSIVNEGWQLSIFGQLKPDQEIVKFAAGSYQMISGVTFAKNGKNLPMACVTLSGENLIVRTEK